MTFHMDDEEKKLFREWNAAHLAECHNGQEPYGGAIGGRVSFIITGTSLGEILSVKCNAADCKREVNPPKSATCVLTDFSGW